MFKALTKHVLTSIKHQGAVFENVVTIDVKCYEFVFPIPDFCKSDLTEYNFVEKFL